MLRKLLLEFIHILLLRYGFLLYYMYIVYTRLFPLRSMRINSITLNCSFLFMSVPKKQHPDNHSMLCCAHSIASATLLPCFASAVLVSCSSPFPLGGNGPVGSITARYPSINGFSTNCCGVTFVLSSRIVPHTKA